MSQCFASCGPVVSWLVQQASFGHRRIERILELSEGKSVISDSAIRVIIALSSTIQRMREFGGGARAEAFCPRDLFAPLPSISERLICRFQHDAHEFFTKSMETLAQEALAVETVALEVATAARDVETAARKVAKAARDVETLKLLEEAPMAPCPLFRGKLMSRITCSECQAVSDTVEDFEGLPIELQGCKRVTAALTKSGEEATLDGDNQYFCKKCGAKTCVSKRMFFKELPECLCLQLKRDATGHTREHLAKPDSEDPGQSNKQDISQKVGHRMTFAKTLDIRGLCVEGPQAMDTEYTLAGVLCHHGNTLNSDHYTAYVRAVNSPDTETWYRRKGELVYDATLDDVQRRKDAYMLFYTRGGGSTADHTGPAIQPSVPPMHLPLAPGVGRSTTDDTGAPAVAAVARCRRQGPKPRQGSVRNGVDGLLVNATIHVRVISPTPLQDCNAAFLFLLQQR